MRRTERLERGDGLLGLALLIHAEHRVDDDDEQNDDDVRKTLVRICARDGRDQRRREQHQDHRIRELGKKALDDRRLRRLCEHIVPVTRQPLVGLRLCESVGRAVECVQRVSG